MLKQKYFYFWTKQECIGGPDLSCREMWLQQRVPSPSCGMTMDKLLIFSDVSLNSPSCKIRRKKIAPTLQAFLRDTVGSVPDTHSEARLPRWCYWSWACLPMGCEMWGDVGLIPGLWDVGSIPGSGRFPGGVNDNLLQNSCLENPMDRGAWQVTVNGLQRVGHNSSDLTHTIKQILR